ncbi:MAG: hypothetical protein ACTSUD_00840 [Alphaproteobacteria bacterium]
MQEEMDGGVFLPGGGKYIENLIPVRPIGDLARARQRGPHPRAFVGVTLYAGIEIGHRIAGIIGDIEGRPIVVVSDFLAHISNTPFLALRHPEGCAAARLVLRDGRKCALLRMSLLPRSSGRTFNPAAHPEERALASVSKGGGQH